MRRSRSVLAVLGLVGGSLAFAGCGGGHPHAAATTTTAPKTSTSSPAAGGRLNSQTLSGVASDLQTLNSLVAQANNDLAAAKGES